MKKRKKKTPSQIAIGKLDKIFSLYIRARDGKCCTRGIRFQCSDVLQCGHLFTRGDKSTRWDERFSFGQCSTHNYSHEFHPEIMTKWFIGKYGNELYKEGCKLTASIYKPTLSELDDKIIYYQNKLKQL